MAMNMMDDFLRVGQPKQEPKYFEPNPERTAANSYVYAESRPPQKPPCDLCNGKGTLGMSIFGGNSFMCPACVDEHSEQNDGQE